MELPIFFALVLLSCLCVTADGAAVLALFSSLSYADHLVFRGYVSLLTRQGHTVVVMTPFPGQFPYPDAENIVEMDVGQESATFWDEFKILMTNTDDYYQRLKSLNEFSLKLAIAQLKSKQMTALFINPNVKFDLVITEADVPVLYALADKYKAPHIAITTTSGKIHQHEAKGNPVHPLMYPDVNTLNYRNNLSTWQKASEFNRHYQTKNEYYNSYLPLCDLAAKKILGLKRDLKDVENDIDLLFIAGNPILTGNRPVGPATVFVDRLHIKPGLNLPPNLQGLLDSSTKGVVYFSLGAIQDSEQLSPQILQTLTDAFKELPYTVLWKIGNITMINKPDNVVAQSWFPQQSVLAHPNVKAFITHGGSRSLEEALFYQVPIIGLPLVKSKKVFIGELTKHGAGEILDSYYLDKDTVKTVITNVVSNPKYKNSISRLRELVTDAIISGPDNALWWTEHVLSRQGGRHLRAPAAGISFIEYFMLNYLIYLLIAFVLAQYVIYLVLRNIARRIRAKFGKSGQHPQSGKFKAL